MRVPLAEAALNYEQHCRRLGEDHACATCQAQMDHSGSEPQEASPIEKRTEQVKETQGENARTNPTPAEKRKAEFAGLSDDLNHLKLSFNTRLWDKNRPSRLKEQSERTFFSWQIALLLEFNDTLTHLPSHDILPFCS